MDPSTDRVANTIMTEIEHLLKDIDPDRKTVMLNAYECMADCYRIPTSIEESAKCAEKCSMPFNRLQMELNHHMNSSKAIYANCMQGCKIQHSDENSEPMKFCLSECADRFIDEFRHLRQVAKDITKRYAK